MLNMLWDQIWPWLLGGGALTGVAFWALGGPAVLRIIASLLDIISPLLHGLGWFLVEFLKVLWKGFKDIVDDWVTIVTVATAAFFLYTGLEAKHTIESLNTKTEIAQLKSDLKKCKPGYKPKTEGNGWFERW